MRKVMRFCSILCAFGFIIPNASASLISSDLSIEAYATFDAVSSYAATGNASQSGNITQIIGGTSTTTMVNNITASGTNPLGGVFTEDGDGLSVSASGFSTAGLLSEIRGFVFDFDFNLANNSATDEYKISFELVFSHLANADGSDAYIDSEIYLMDSSLDEKFATDLTSDTYYGDEIGDENGSTSLSSKGASLSDSGTFLFDFTLAAGASESFSAVLKMDARTYNTNSLFNADSSAFFRVVGAENLTSPTDPGTDPGTGNATPVPEPSTLMLLAIFLVLIPVKRKIN